jgi:hypothetical protein
MELQQLQELGIFSRNDAADLPAFHSDTQECQFPSSTTKANQVSNAR